jgi:hypothetical protein
MRPALMTCLVLCLGSTLCADEFRLHSKVYLGKDEEPAYENVTLFRDGLVYDLLSDPDEVVVFDTAKKRFVILSPPRRVRAEISLEMIETSIQYIRQNLARKLPSENPQDSLIGFVLNPKYEIQAAEGSDAVEFIGRWMSYRLKTTPARTPTAAAQYAEFLSGYTKLSAMKKAPLLARGPINAWLASKGRIPVEIEVTQFRRGPLGGMKPQSTDRSEHVLTWQLPTQDRQKIEQIERWLVEFQPVGFNEYWNASQGK